MKQILKYVITKRYHRLYESSRVSIECSLDAESTGSSVDIAFHKYKNLMQRKNKRGVIEEMYTVHVKENDFIVYLLIINKYHLY